MTTPILSQAQDLDVTTYAIMQTTTTNGVTSQMPLVWDISTLSQAQEALALTDDSANAFVGKYIEHYSDLEAYQRRLSELVH